MKTLVLERTRWSLVRFDSPPDSMKPALQHATILISRKVSLLKEKKALFDGDLIKQIYPRPPE